MVEFDDGSVKAQIGPPDMKLPIQYAMLYPERQPNEGIPRLDITQAMSMTFEPMNPGPLPLLPPGSGSRSEGRNIPRRPLRLRRNRRRAVPGRTHPLHPHPQGGRSRPRTLHEPNPRRQHRTHPHRRPVGPRHRPQTNPHPHEQQPASPSTILPTPSVIPITPLRHSRAGGNPSPPSRSP